MRYSVSHTKAGVNTADTPMWVLRPGTNDAWKVYEIALSVGGATSPSNGPMWRLARTSALGTQNSQVTPIIEEAAADTPNGRLDVGWSANPTTPTQASFGDLRRFSTPNAIGNGVVWTWYDTPLYVAAGSGVCVLNGVAAGASLGSFNIYVRFDE